MAKHFSPEFKQQAIDYILSNSHESVATIAQKLGVDYWTLDKWFRETNPASSSKHQPSLEQQRIFSNKSFQEKYTVIQYKVRKQILHNRTTQGWLYLCMVHLIM